MMDSVGTRASGAGPGQQLKSNPVNHHLPAWLKNATAPAHGRIERRLDIFDPAFNLERYRKLLQRFYAFYKPWEAALHRRFDPSLAAFFGGRRKVHHISSDLNYLNAPPLAGAEAIFPHLNGLPEALGSLYVMEGATLGGQIIARHLEQTFGFSNGDGYRFFRGYGPATSAKWRAFQHLLTLYSSPALDSRIVDGAVLTFEAFDQWLEETAQ